MPYRIIVLVFAVLLSLVPLGSVSAQDRPTVQEQRQTLEDGGLPEASDFGSGWSLSAAFTFEGESPSGFDVHEAVYADRFGTRIYVVSALYDRRSKANALSVLSGILDTHSSLLLPSESAPTARELRALDDPAGCSYVQRATGEDPLSYFFFGSLICQDDGNDRMLLVSVSGNYDGTTFQEAAEEVLEIVLDIEPDRSGVAGQK